MVCFVLIFWKNLFELHFLNLDGEGLFVWMEKSVWRKEKTCELQWISNKWMNKIFYFWNCINGKVCLCCYWKMFISCLQLLQKLKLVFIYFFLKIFSFKGMFVCMTYIQSTIIFDSTTWTIKKYHTVRSEDLQ